MLKFLWLPGDPERYSRCVISTNFVWCLPGSRHLGRFCFKVSSMNNEKESCSYNIWTSENGFQKVLLDLRNSALSLYSKEVEQEPLWKEGRRIWWTKAGNIYLGYIRKGCRDIRNLGCILCIKRSNSKFQSRRITDGKAHHRPLPGTLRHDHCIRHSLTELRILLESLLVFSFLGWISWSIFSSHLMDTAE